MNCGILEEIAMSFPQKQESIISLCRIGLDSQRVTDHARLAGMTINETIL
jgi:hypothetical protein